MISPEKVVRFLSSTQSELEPDDSLIDEVETLLELGNIPTPYRIRNLKLRLALYFSPKNVIGETELESGEPRYIICAEYIQKNFEYTASESREIAKSVQRILDSWDEGRKTTSKHKDKLLRRQSYRCNNCNLHFNEDNLPYIKEDEYKPVYLEENLTEPEVDHIDPVWALGQNSIDNLHVLCRFCNQGKGGLLETSISEEMKNANQAIDGINWRYRAEVFYLAVANIDECVKCGNSEQELTARPIRRQGCYTKANLQPVCVDCAYN